jgi:hypothetical protein
MEHPARGGTPLEARRVGAAAAARAAATRPPPPCVQQRARAGAVAGKVLKQQQRGAIRPRRTCPPPTAAHAPRPEAPQAAAATRPRPAPHRSPLPPNPHHATCPPLPPAWDCPGGVKGSDQVTGYTTFFGIKEDKPLKYNDHLPAWKKFGSITKVNLYYSYNYGCVQGVKVTYGYDARNAQLIGVEKGLKEVSLNLRPYENIVKAEVKQGGKKR